MKKVFLPYLIYQGFFKGARLLGTEKVFFKSERIVFMAAYTNFFLHLVTIQGLEPLRYKRTCHDLTLRTSETFIGD